MTATLRTFAFSIALALSVAACGVPQEDGPPPDGATSPGETSTSAETGTGDGDPGPDPDGPDPDDPDDPGPGPVNVVVGWILDLGAGAPAGPADESAAHVALWNRDCATALKLATGNAILEAAATACLAAQTGDASLWRSAEQQRAALPEAGLSCLDVAELAALDRLLEAYRENPDASITLSSGSGSSRPPCPTEITIDPATGPAGTEVTISVTTSSSSRTSSSSSRLGNGRRSTRTRGRR